MRKRWDIGEGCLSAVVGVWIFGWIPIFAAIWGLGAPGGLDSKTNYLPALLFLAGWFGIVIVPFVLCGAYFVCLSAWADRPRRVAEPVTTDLREHK